MFQKEASSFRDPSGFVFYKNSRVYRQINYCYKDGYEYFINSGLKEELLKNKLLIPFCETSDIEISSSFYKIIEVEKIPTVIYPYEWCFSQLKDAALTTLRIHKKALEYDMVLKDASAYNIQFWQGLPVLIDILSFEKYVTGSTWKAYKQFCQHFLGPLLLMKYKSIELGQMSKLFVDGLPIELTSSLLPLKTYFNINILTHIHSHAFYQKKYKYKNKDLKKLHIAKEKQTLLIENLIHFIENLNIKNIKTEWTDYYHHTNYSENAINYKKELVKNFSKSLEIKKLIDFGANDGTFSRVFSEQKIETIAIDIDPLAVEKNYIKTKKSNDIYMTPLLADISNPNPAIGWENAERISLLHRLDGDLVLVLALVHHLFITHNLSFEHIASFIARFYTYAIVEYIPFDDNQIQKMILNRTDNYDSYTETNFEKAFRQFFSIVRKEKIMESGRYLYLFDRLKE